MSKELEALLERYWDLAYLEGKSGVSQGDKANEVLSALRKLADQPAQRKPLTDADCTRIYNEANGITTKNPPITTERIFKAMRAANNIKEQP